MDNITPEIHLVRINPPNSLKPESGISPLRLEELRINSRQMAAPYERPTDLFDFFVLAEQHTADKCSIAPIPFRRYDHYGPVTPNEVNELCFFLTLEAQKNDTYLIVTPELSSYSHPQVAQPIQFDALGEVISGQESVIMLIQKAKELARTHNTTIVLSSICEQKKLKSGKLVSYNSTLVIGPSGTIDKRRKIGDIHVKNDSEWVDVMDIYDELRGGQKPLRDPTGITEAEHDEIVQDTLKTLKPFEIIDKTGKRHRAIILVCSEIGIDKLYDHVPDDVEIVIIPMSEGEDDYKGDFGISMVFAESNSVREQLDNNPKRSGKITLVRTNERGRIGSVVQYSNRAKFDAVSLYR